MGNRLQKTDSSTGTTGYGYDAANRLLSATGTGASTYANDADGNTLTDTGGRTMNWDSQNRMVSCAYNGQTTTNTYGADGLRRSSTVNGVTTYYAYDGQTLIREMHKNVTTGALYNTATYLQGMRGPEYRWYVYDGLGSVVGEVDVNGNLTSSPKYDVYGLVRANPGTASSAMGFVGGLGHLSEAGTGLIYMKARYYDPSLGRFVSQDTAKDGVDWFAYCDNNPVNEADSDGKMAGVIAVILLAAVASFYAYVGNIIGYDWFLDTCIDSSDPPLPRKMLTLGGSLTADITGGTIGFLLRGAMYGSGIGFAALGGALGIAAIVGFIIGFESGVIEAEIDAIDSY